MRQPPHLHDTTPTPQPNRAKAGGIVVLIVVVVALATLKSTAVVVPPGYRGVVFNSIRGGIQQTVLHEGLNLVNPVTSKVTLLDVRTQTYTMSNAADEGQVQGRDGIEAKTQDGQRVEVDVSLRYHVDPDKAVDVYRNLGADYEAKLVLPTIRSAVRNIFSEYPVDAVYSEQRQVISDELTKDIAKTLTVRGLLVDEFLLRNINFSPEYAAAIENKQIEQQNDQRKRHEVEIAKKEAEKQRIEAAGEAESNDIRGAALRVNPKVIQYDYVRKVAPNVQVMVVDKDEIMRSVPTAKP